jgi:U3 small nucleolar RNA-associated protein 20
VLRLAGFVPLLTMVLYPKLAKRSGRLRGRGAPGSARAAVLNALAALQPAELTPLLELLLMPISSAFKQPGQDEAAEAAAAAVDAEAAATLQEINSCRLIPAPWWSNHLVNSSLDWWLTAVDRSALAAQPLRRRQGFLNAFEDLLGHLGYQLQPLLPALLAITLQLLQTAAAGLQAQQQDAAAASDASGAAAADAQSREEGRAVRSQCLRLLAQVFSRFPSTLDLNPLWPGFFGAAVPLMARLVPESVGAAPPALLAAVEALAANPGLARVLGDLPSQQLEPQDASSSGLAMDVDSQQQQQQQGEDPGFSMQWPPGQQPHWAAEGLGGKLLCSCIRVLGSKGCSDASRSAALSVAEACLALQPPELLAAVLLRWTPLLLVELKASVEAALVAAAAAAGPNKGGRGRVSWLLLQGLWCLAVSTRHHNNNRSSVMLSVRG